VRALLSERGPDGRIAHHPYAKWVGAHWVVATLADLGYPPGDESLAPLFEQVYAWLLAPEHLRGMPTYDGRPRRHASMEANAVLAALRLGLADARTDELVRRLTAWQWPDGGWNCDKRRAAHQSSFAETLLPLRALALYARATGAPRAGEAAARAAEVFLTRRLFRRRRDGAVMDARFVVLHYPWYWRYDVLAGLVAMAEAGYVHDARCAEALDLLRAKRLPDGGWPAEACFYRRATRPVSGQSLVGWGGANATRANEWTTAHALVVLRAAGQL
jgi:hypothetical protein